jgi:selenocysteine-specific elongation factor
MSAAPPPLPIVLGTAGHIDHGKTSLVHALTGIDPDRLPIEKARGITTELGFARLDLDEHRIAVVDVPGHERFVRSMVAGATGLDLVCLVIAADEGVMPQTREHLEICDLLGVRRGLIALTKVDLVDTEWLELVTEEVRVAIAKTFLAGAPLLPVSARTGSGLPALRAAIGAAIATLPPRSTAGVFRLPIDRVFTMRGFGTVVTGTILGGEVAVGDEVAVLPSGGLARVRGLEVHGAPVARALAGHRAALNLSGVAVDELARGDVLAHPGTVEPSHILDVELRYLASAPSPLPRRARILLHHGTAQVSASVVLVDPAIPSTGLVPGVATLAQLRLDAATPLAALPGDPFIARGFVARSTHGTTIAGGRVIRVLAPKARRGAEHAAQVTGLAAARLEERAWLEIAGAEAAGLTAVAISRRVGAPLEALTEPLATAVAAGDLLMTGAGEHAHYLHAKAVARIEAKISALLQSAAPGLPREDLRTQLPAALPPRAYDAILAGLARRGRVVLAGERVLTAGPVPRPQGSSLDAEVLERFRAWALEPPRPREVAQALGRPEGQVKSALDRLIATKHLVRVKADLLVEAAALAALRDRLVAFLGANQTITPAQWKELAGVSRKYSIPLAEHFDSERLTLRVGDLRRRR